MFIGTGYICFDRFFLDATSYQGRGNEYLNNVGERPPKSVQIFMDTP
jgi:hypothetical protein